MSANVDLPSSAFSWSRGECSMPAIVGVNRNMSLMKVVVSSDLCFFEHDTELGVGCD